MSNIKYLRQVIQAAKRDLIHERRHEAAKKLDEAAELLVNDDASEAVKDEALVRYGKLWVSMKDELIPAIERRLEGLEKNVKDLEVRHDRQCFLNDRIATYADADLLKRLEKMEKALSEEMAKTREMDDILAGVVKKVGYVSEAPDGDFKSELLKWLDIEIAMAETNLEEAERHHMMVPVTVARTMLATYKAVKAHIQG